MELRSKKIGVSDAFEAVELFFQRRWSDGLPIVPPTPEKVEEMISSVNREPQEVIGAVPPKQGIATIEKLAINSVMAGCLPEYFPVVIAAVEAVLDPHHGLNGTQTTTHMNEPLIIVNGPAVKKLNINSRDSVFGRGFRANGTIGRALRLILWNLGGNYPGEVDKSCFSHPGSWSFCIAEAEDSSPWAPLHVERGFSKEASTVTVFSCEPPHSIWAHGTADEVLRGTISAMATTSNNNFCFPGGETLVVFCPHNAKQLAESGWSKEDIKNYIWENTKFPLKRLKEASQVSFLSIAQRYPNWLSLPEEELIPIVEKPEDIHIIVAGGEYFDAVCPGWGYFGGLAVTKEIKSS